MSNRLSIEHMNPPDCTPGFLKESTTARGLSSSGSAFHAFATDWLNQFDLGMSMGGFNPEMQSASTTQNEEQRTRLDTATVPKLSCCFSAASLSRTVRAL
jgi:hypothetical protein